MTVPILTRRSVMSRLAAMGLAAPLMLRSQSASAATVVRHDVDSPEGKAMLAIYADAVGAMKRRAKGDPRGWLFQWYVHAIPDDRTKTAEIRRIYKNPASARRALALATWSTCKSHNGEREDYFLPWHRMFVLYFEDIIRAVSGRPDFTLPYWDYTDLAKRVLPIEFRRANSAKWKSLYRASRNPGVNAGQRIDTLPGANDINLDALRSSSYSDNGSDAGFCSNLDQNPHGALHVDIGNQVGMGQVPWAANDPIFWIHHCNVDRLWASWTRAGGGAPTDAAFLNRQFVFADGLGHSVSRTISEVLALEPLNYAYASYVLRPPGSPPFPAARVAGAAPMLGAAPPAVHAASSQAGVALGATPAKVPLTLQPFPSLGASPNETFSVQRDTLPPEVAVHLRLENVTASAQPATSYDVYLDPPSGQAPTRADASFVGSLNFFAVVRHAGHDQADMAAGEEMGAPRNFSFDVTEVVRKLKAANRLSDVPSVVLAPNSAPVSGAAPRIGRIALVSG